jgi:hypothetical protein
MQLISLAGVSINMFGRDSSVPGVTEVVMPFLGITDLRRPLRSVDAATKCLWDSRASQLAAKVGKAFFLVTDISTVLGIRK